MRIKKTIVYYTDSRLEPGLELAVRNQIKKASNGIKIISVSQKPLDFGKNICVGLKPRCYLSLYEQVLNGINHVDEDSIIYLCEHDVFYHPSHFDFIPEFKNKIYFNKSRYYWQRNTNYFVNSVGRRALSQCVSYKNVLKKHIKDQVNARKNGDSSPCIGPFFNFTSDFANIDVRHGANFSNSRRFTTPKKDKMIWEVPEWGTPRMLQEKVGFRNWDIRTRERMHTMLNKENKPNPVTVEIFIRKNLPEMFASLEFKKGAEVGVKRGVYSKLICESIPGVNLKCIDNYHPGPGKPWDEQEEFCRIAKSALNEYDAEIIKKSSLQAADEDVPKESLDFVYIDASHEFNDVMQDIIVWSDRVRPGGVVSGHDYDNEDVRTAVDTYTKIHDLELFLTRKDEGYPDAHPSWFFAK